jgi:hypothetical protein
MLLNKTSNEHLTHIPSKVYQFIHQVIVDGRYVDEFQQKPHDVAQRLGVTIDPEIESALRTTTANQLFDILYREQFKLTPDNLHPYILTNNGRQSPALAVIAAGIAGGIAVTVIATIVIFAKNSPSSVNHPLNYDIIDESDERDAKL